MTVSHELAEFLTGTPLADLPQQAVEHAAMLIASTLASAALGAGLESSQIIRDLARERGGRPDASLWFSSDVKLPTADVAQVNAVASDAAASDDSDLRNIVHAGTTVVATALAVAEAPVARARTCWRRSSSAMRRRDASGKPSHQAFASRDFTGASSRYSAVP